MRWRVQLLIIGILATLGTLHIAAQGVRAVVVNEFINVRVIPAIGAEVIGSVGAGYVFEVITARSADNQWLRVDYVGQEGWINLAPLTILDGNIAALPVADPRTIPYGGFEASRSGTTSQTGSVAARASAGVRVRAGPSTAYPTLANINFNQLMSLTGRTRSNLWLQVSFEGNLGWVSGAYVEILSGDVLTLPIDGIVADKPPISGDGTEEYIAQLKLMRDRITIARASLNAIRTSWTDAALTGRASCQAYPPQPSDLNIPIPLLAAFNNTLEPLKNDFNIAMANLRRAINLFIEVCNQPGTGNPVGTATVQGALDVVNLTETQFTDLERRLALLIPAEGGAGQCLLVYRGKTEVLPVITYGTIYLDQFTTRSYSAGYCFDGIEQQNINFQALPLPDSDLQLFVAIAPLDDPTNFVGIIQRGTGEAVSLGPITLPRTTRYVIIIADIQSRETGPKGDFAIRVADVTGLTTTSILTYDEATKSVILTTSGSTTTTDASTTTTTTSTTTTVCPSTALTCSQLFNCAEARACLAAGNFSLDADNDSIPCEDTVCAGQ